MRSQPVGLLVLIVAGLLPYTTGGCGGSLLDSLSFSDGASPTDVLDQLTAGDLAEAFEDFRNGLLDTSFTGRATDLSDAQRAAIEDLQGRYDAGEITQDQFITGVAEALQDTSPNSPFAGFRFLGFPFDGAGANDFADVLGLSADQQQQALLIYRALHGDIGDVRAAAKDQIRALLSSQQRVILDQVASGLFAQFGIPAEQRAGAQLVFDLMVQRLGLTFDQQAQIEAIRADLRDVVQQLHAGASAQFDAILSDAQLPILDLIKGLSPVKGYAGGTRWN